MSEADRTRAAMAELKAAKRRAGEAKAALNLVAQREFAIAAAEYLRNGAKMSGHPAMAALIADDLLHPHVFSQKTPPIMRFYRNLLAGIGEPKAIFEIGVKNGGSLALWHQLFPAAQIVGLDINLAKAVRHEGIVYVEGSQTDTALLAAIAAEHGPFGLVIDDGSHVGAHQLVSLRALASHVAPGGAYVIEDVHASVKPDEKGAAYGEDIWAPVVAYLFDRLRSRETDRRTASPAVMEALDLAAAIRPLIAEVVLAHHVLAFRMKD